MRSKSPRTPLQDNQTIVVAAMFLLTARCFTSAQLRFTHSLSTYRLQGRDHVHSPARKSLHALCANFRGKCASSSGDQSASPAATRAPKFARSHFSQGNVNVFFFCVMVSLGSKSPSAS